MQLRCAEQLDTHTGLGKDGWLYCLSWQWAQRINTMYGCRKVTSEEV